MRVTIAEDTRLVSPVNTEFDELWVTLKPNQNPTPRGGTIYKALRRPEQRPADDRSR